MRHLDDGQIAELIDRAGAAGAAGAADHLVGCSACRERVEEARLVAERARSILATAVPAAAAETAVPPFEEILHRAGRARRAGRGGGRIRWLAWAATVVVAGGLGWYARGEFRTASRAAPSAVTSQTLPDTAVPVTEADRVGALDDERRADAADTPPAANEVRDRVMERGPAERPAESPPAREEAAGAEGYVVRSQRAAADEAKAAAASPPPAPSVAAPLPMARVATDSLRAARERALRRTPAQEVEQAPAVVAALGRRAEPSLGRIVISRETAEHVLGGSLATIEGVPIEEYYMLVGEEVVQTVQRLPRGEVLELEQWRANQPRTAEGLAAGAMAGRQRRQEPARADSAVIAAESLLVDGLRIVGRAPISADSLRVLLRKVRR
jgi:hypothetical protein